MPTVQDERIAELVVQRRLLTPEQVSECQLLQSQSPTPCTLAQVIVSRRYATAEALRALALGPGATHASGSTASSPGLPPGGSRSGGFFPTGDPAAAAPPVAAAGDDVEVAFGRFLIAEGLISVDQAREAYKLLTGYRQQFPQVNLSQVLAKHGMCDKEALRGAYQRFMAQRDAAPPTASTTAAPAHGGAVGSEPRFGFKTVELDPQERPDYVPLSPFAAPAGAPAPALDPGTLDAFLPIDSSPQHAPPRFLDNETLVDRPRAPAYPGPAQTGPGATAGESRWTSELGPNGTHAGPRGTHRQRLGGPDTAALLPPAQPVKLPPPIQLKPDLDDDDEDDDEADHADVKAPGKKRKAAGDTDIQSSTFGAARKRRAAAPARSGPPMPVIAAIAGGVVLVLTVGLWMLAHRMELKSAKREFLSAVGTEPAEVMLDRHKALPAALLDDPEIVAAHEKLEAEVQRLRARKQAEQELAKLAAAKTLEERLAICDRAIEADDSFATAWVERARVKLALARKRALERGPGGRPADVTAEPMQDVDQAILRDPSSALAYLVKAQLYLVNARQPDARDKAKSALKNVMSQDQNGPLGALARGMVEHYVSGDWDKAIQQFDRAIELDPKLLDAYLLRADARLRKRDYARALADASAATRMDPSSSLALTLQAEGRYFSTLDASNRSGDRAGALQDLDRALGLDPSNGRALALRAYARLERDRIGDVTSTQDDQDRARRDAESALVVDPDQPLAHLALAEIAQAQKRGDEALLHASHAVECGRHLPMVYLVRGRIRARLDDVEQAKQDFDEVERLEPGNARALTNKAAVLVKQSDLDSARSYLDRAITSDPELSEAYFHRGIIHLKSRPQQTQLAIDDFSKAIELKPQFPDAYFYRACAFSYLSSWERCLDDLEKAEAQRRDDGQFHLRDVYLLRGHCHYRKGDFREAQQAYETYLDKAPPGAKAIDKVKRRLEQIRAGNVEQDGDTDFEEPSR